MYLSTIKLQNFRNYENIKIDLSPGVNIIYGNNAQGKTNLLESIYYLSVTKSHHSFLDNSLIRNGSDNLYVEGIVRKDEISDKYSISLNNHKKILKINDEKVNKISDYISNINTIFFYPDDLSLIKGNPEVRRRYLNVQLSQLSSIYFKNISDYNKLLKIRNEYLKKYVDRIDFDENYFDIITDHLIDKSIYIYKMRKKYISKINDYCKKISQNIFNNDNFKIIYKTNFDNLDFTSETIKEQLKEEYKKNLYRDKKYKITLLGPQKDDIEFLYDDKNLKLYGSQGQQRLGVLVFKLSEINIFNDFKNTKPILLLDDVFSELDNIKKNNLLHYINNDIQTIITTTDLSNLDKLLIEKSNLIKIFSGKIEEVEENGTK